MAAVVNMLKSDVESYIPAEHLHIQVTDPSKPPDRSLADIAKVTKHVLPDDFSYS